MKYESYTVAIPGNDRVLHGPCTLVEAVRASQEINSRLTRAPFAVWTCVGEQTKPCASRKPVSFLEYATLAQIARLIQQRNRWQPKAYEAEIFDLLACLKTLRKVSRS